MMADKVKRVDNCPLGLEYCGEYCNWYGKKGCIHPLEGWGTEKELDDLEAMRELK